MYTIQIKNTHKEVAPLMTPLKKVMHYISVGKNMHEVEKYFLWIQAEQM